MIGDVVIDSLTWLRQMFCMHEYKSKFSKMGVFNWLRCDKCGKCKDFCHL